MFFWYFGVPPLLPEAAREWLFDHGAEFWAGMFALGVYHGARMSEVIRSGIQSIPKTQFEAAVAMGLTTFQAYRLVILDRKSTRLNSSHQIISYAVFCLKKKKKKSTTTQTSQ